MEEIEIEARLIAEPTLVSAGRVHDKNRKKNWTKRKNEWEYTSKKGVAIGRVKVLSIRIRTYQRL